MLAAVAHADAPDAVNYQGMLYAQYAPANGSYDLQFALYADESGGTPWAVIDSPQVPVEQGVFRVDISELLAAAPLARFLEVSVQPAQGAEPDTLPRLKLGSASFASGTEAASVAPLAPRALPVLAGRDGARGPMGPRGLPGTAGAQGPAGSDGAMGPLGPQGPQGVAGDEGAAGPQGIQGPAGPSGSNGASGIVATGSFSGLINTIAASSSAYVFAGGTATVTTTAGQRLTATAVGPMGLAAASAVQNGIVDVCYQPSAGGTISNFAGGSYMLHRFGPQRTPYAAAGSVVPGANTWKVGLCVRNTGAVAITDNDYSNGWVQVTN